MDVTSCKGVNSIRARDLSPRPRSKGCGNMYEMYKNFSVNEEEEHRCGSLSPPDSRSRVGGRRPTWELEPVERSAHVTVQRTAL